MIKKDELWYCINYARSSAVQSRIPNFIVRTLNINLKFVMCISMVGGKHIAVICDIQYRLILLTNILCFVFCFFLSGFIIYLLEILKSDLASV